MTYFYNIRSLRNERIHYLALLNDIKSERKKEKNLGDSIGDVISKTPLSDIDIFSFGMNLDSEYNNSVFTTHTHLLWDIYNYETNPTYTKEYFETNIDEQYNELSDELDDNPDENIKNEYYRCVNLIKKFKFEIYHIKKNILKFKNRTESSLCGDCDTFIFSCKYDKYVFDVIFYDDCDCYPGILYVKTIKDVTNNVEIDINCDLYCNNTPHHILHKFISILNGVSIDQYYEELYKPIDYVLSYLQNELGIEAKHVSDDNPIQYVLKSGGNPICTLVVTNDWLYKFNLENIDSYPLLLFTMCPLWTEMRDLINSSSQKSMLTNCQKINKEIMVCDEFKNNSVNFKTVDNYVNNLTKIMHIYTSLKNKRIGFLENNHYYTTQDLKKDLNNMFNKSSASISTFTDYINDLHIALSIVEKQSTCFNSNDSELLRKHNIRYPIDEYKITVWYKYDPNQNPQVIHLKIEGKYSLMNEYIKKHYVRNSYEITYYDVFPIYHYKGTYSQVLNEIKQFITIKSGRY